MTILRQAGAIGRAWSEKVADCRFLWASSLLAVLGMASSLEAQTVFCVDDHGKVEVVRRASRSGAMVEENGKWVTYDTGPFLLKPAPEYLPAVITIRNRQFAKGGRAISDSGPSPARLVGAGRFVYTADLDASTELKNVMLVLELGGPKEEDHLFSVHEIRDMRPNRSERVSVDVTVDFKLRGIHLKHTYLYSNGLEVFTSELQPKLREAALEAMVTKRIKAAATKDVELQPLFAPEPVFPEKLKSSAKGDATVVFRVDANGYVLEPVVTKASLPDFSEPALAAIKQWRFVPAMKSGSPVESRGSYTFHFEMPSSW